MLGTANGVGLSRHLSGECKQTATTRTFLQYMRVIQDASRLMKLGFTVAYIRPKC
jgi:hypothetical protein